MINLANGKSCCKALPLGIAVVDDGAELPATTTFHWSDVRTVTNYNCMKMAIFWNAVP
jgi:hypothetical protein